MPEAGVYYMLVFSSHCIILYMLLCTGRGLGLELIILGYGRSFRETFVFQSKN